MPAELDSLKAVLEMKNEEIKRLRTEKMEKHLEVYNMYFPAFPYVVCYFLAFSLQRVF